jgi:PAS domain S-box-containing protein
MLAFATIGLLPLLLTGALVGWYNFTTEMAEARSRELGVAKAISERLSDLLQTAERQLALPVRLAGPVRSLADYRPVLERLLTDRATYREIFLLDAQGVEQFRLSNVRLPTADQPPRPPNLELVASATEGVNAFTGVYHDPATGEPLMELAVPVIEPRSGHLTGVVVAEIRMRAIWDLLTNLRLDPGEDAYIADGAGVIIAHRNPSVVLRGSRLPTFDHDHHWQTGLTGSRVLAVERHLSVDRREFTVVVERSLASALQPAKGALVMVGAVMALSLLLAGGLFLMAVRSVVRPVQAISAVAQAVRDGDLDQRAEVMTNDEIGRLATTFNDMTARLRGVLGDLRVEVEERRQTEARLIKINNAYQALSGCSTLLAKATSEADIVNGVCRIITDDCGYQLVWLGYVEADGAIRPVAFSGDTNGYVGALNIHLKDPVTSLGPSATAIRERRRVVIDDISLEPSFSPWRTAAERNGYRSHASLPLLAGGGQALGVLAVYSDQVAPFNQEETRLLAELSANLAHGLVGLRTRRERLRAEQALLESEARLRQVTNALPALLWTWTEQGVTYFNERWYAYTGLTEAEALGDGWLRTVHPDDLAVLDAKWDEAVQGGHRFEMEQRVLRHDGVYRWFLVQAEPTHTEKGVAPLWIGTCLDIEDRKRSEAQLIQASKLATLGEMAAGMAHELGQPLNIIRMTADTAGRRVETGRSEPAQLRRDLKLVGDQTQRMGQLIEHMRAFSRDDNLLQEVIDLGEVAEAASGLLSAQMKAHGVDLTVTRPELPLPVLGNRVQIEQVVLNLLANARDAVEEVPADQLRTIQVVVSADADRRIATVTVADSGSGIPPAIVDRMFEPFVTTKAAGKGTGLGLAICLRIVAHMGGTLQARNRRPGPGAEFVVTLPLSDQAAAPAPAQAQAPTEADAPRRILVVDDEVAAADIIGHFLSEMGYEVSVTHSVAEAIQAFAAQPVDLVVTDITMPDGDGQGLLRQLRQNADALPAVVVTGRIDAAALLAEELATGHTRLLRKPISIVELSSVVADLLCEEEPAPV